MNISVHLSLGCSRTHDCFLLRGPFMDTGGCIRPRGSLQDQCLNCDFLFFSSIVLSVVPSYCLCDPYSNLSVGKCPSALNAGPFVWCVLQHLLTPFLLTLIIYVKSTRHHNLLTLNLFFHH